MAGPKRIIDSLLLDVTYQTAVAANAEMATDASGWSEARSIPVKLLGNARFQGSYDNVAANFVDKIEDDHTYIRVSTDGGLEWIVFKVSACNGSESSHPAVTVADNPYININPTTQVLTVTAPITSGTNTGDETTATIRAKLNLGPTDLLSGSNTGDETDVTIKEALGVTTLSGDNTGDQTATTVPVTDTADVFTGTNVETVLKELYDKVLQNKTVFSLTLPSSTTVAGRINAGVTYGEGTEDWILTPGTSPVDLVIQHNMGSRRVSSVTVFAIDGTYEQQLFNTAAYNGIQGRYEANQWLWIQSLATIQKPIKIYISFC